MDTTDPEIYFDKQGICNHCNEFDKFTSKRWFPNQEGKKKLNIISFGIENNLADIKFKSIKKEKNFFKIHIKINHNSRYFLISNDFKNHIYNILASLAIMSIYIDILKIKKKIFLNFKTPHGRGDILKIKIKNKKINLIDESYNSNPLSLKSAILNFDKIISNKSKKYLLIGDMLELRIHSQKLHESIAPIINRTKIDKVFVKGSGASIIFRKLFKSKKGRIFKNKSQINEFIRKELDNNDYIMIKASNATGFNKIVSNLKGQY